MHSLDRIEDVALRATERGETEKGKLGLQLTDIMTAERKIVGKISGTPAMGFMKGQGRLSNEASSSSMSAQSKASSAESCSSRCLSKIRMEGAHQSLCESGSCHDLDRWAVVQRHFPVPWHFRKGLLQLPGSAS